MVGIKWTVLHFKIMADSEKQARDEATRLAKEQSDREKEEQAKRDQEERDELRRLSDEAKGSSQAETNEISRHNR